LHNHTDRRTPEIEAVYLHTSKGWSLEQNGESCPYDDSGLGKGIIRHFVKAPVVRLSPGAWAQLVVKGEKTVWSKYGPNKEEPKGKYPLNGFVTVEIVTSEGSFAEKLNVETVAEELPF